MFSLCAPRRPVVQTSGRTRPWSTASSCPTASSARSRTQGSRCAGCRCANAWWSRRS